ncbi:MAG: hypothetical protein V4819_20230 [Verrucomicrobiota bacterium]
MAAAAADLEIRSRALAAWRAQQVATLCEDPGSPFDAFVKKADPAVVVSIKSGEVGLSQVNFKVWEAYEESETTRQANVKAIKNSFWKLLQDLLSDQMEKHADRKVIPRHIVVLGDGSHTFWRYRRGAVIFARDQGLPFLIMGIDPTKTKVKDVGSPDNGAGASDEEEAARLEDEIADFEEYSAGRGAGEGNAADAGRKARED